MEVETTFLDKNPMSGPSPIEVSIVDNDDAPYELCFVFPVDEATKSFTGDGQRIVKSIIRAGFKTYIYYSIQQDEIYVLARAGEDIIDNFADVIDFKLLMDPVDLKKRANAGLPEKGIAAFDIRHEPQVSSLAPYDHIWGEYDADPHVRDLFWRPEGLSSPFRESVRIKLSLMVLEAPQYKGGAGLSLRTDKQHGSLLAYFPLHKQEDIKPLSKKWLTYCSAPWNQPYDEIRDYFGEKIALYFKFLGHYTTWLIIPALIGLACQLVVIGTGDFSHPILPFFALLIAVWAVLMLEFWKREEKFTALQWGMLGFEETEIDRPEFFGEETKSYIDGSLTTYYPPKKHQGKVAKSFIMIGCLALIVLGAVISIYVIREILYRTAVGDYSQLIASIMNSIQITIFNVIYSQLADHLTEKENHRTDTSFEDSMIAKLFMFQFVNSYASFFYLGEFHHLSLLLPPPHSPRLPLHSLHRQLSRQSRR
jgi:hypothetical protein